MRPKSGSKVPGRDLVPLRRRLKDVDEDQGRVEHIREPPVSAVLSLVYIYIYIYICMLCVYIYIYILHNYVYMCSCIYVLSVLSLDGYSAEGGAVGGGAVDWDSII